MSEYNMTHTGKELDDAIAKVQSGYVFPNQAVEVNVNGVYNTIKNIPVKLLDEITVNVPQGLIERAYITPAVLGSDAKTLSYTFDFVPKVLCLISQTSVTKSSTNSYIVSWLWDKSTGSVQQRVLYVASSAIAPQSVTQGSGTGTFPITISGTKVTWSPSTTLKNSAGTSYNFRFKSGVTYRVLALG